MKPKTRQKADGMNWQKAIEQVFTGKRAKFECKDMVVAPAKVKELVEAMGWRHIPPEDGGELETNGWDYDWWLNFEHCGKRVTVSGSGYYGGLTIYESD